ncbi:MAG: hypothetical protein LBQ79_02540 [Deltaproteobacteria bacterium]|nr:hypothetical protein [Deltaproteobacteria bacterium]
MDNIICTIKRVRTGNTVWKWDGKYLRIGWSGGVAWTYDGETVTGEYPADVSCWKWDGKILRTAHAGMHVWSWDGESITDVRKGVVAWKFDGSSLKEHPSGETVWTVDGEIPIPMLIVGCIIIGGY